MRFFDGIDRRRGRPAVASTTERRDVPGVRQVSKPVVGTCCVPLSGAATGGRPQTRPAGSGSQVDAGQLQELVQAVVDVVRCGCSSSAAVTSPPWSRTTRAVVSRSSCGWPKGPRCSDAPARRSGSQRLDDQPPGFQVVPRHRVQSCASRDGPRGGRRRRGPRASSVRSADSAAWWSAGQQCAPATPGR
jgi:hypothetical protein